MAIKLSESSGKFISKAGENVLLKITKAKYDQEFGKVEIVLENEHGETVNNNFGLLNQDESANEGAIKAFSYFSRVALGDWGRDEVEEDELVGRFVRADIKMVKGSKPSKDGKVLEFANIDKVYMTEDSFDFNDENALNIDINSDDDDFDF